MSKYDSDNFYTICNICICELECYKEQRDYLLYKLDDKYYCDKCYDDIQKKIEEDNEEYREKRKKCYYCRKSTIYEIDGYEDRYYNHNDERICKDCYLKDPKNYTHKEICGCCDCY